MTISTELRRIDEEIGNLQRLDTAEVTVSVTEAWAWPIIVAHVMRLRPDALLFPALDHNKALDAHHAAVAALRLPPSTLHDHRHHYAVALRRRGVSDGVIATQLSHGSTTLVATRRVRATPVTPRWRRVAGAFCGISAT